MMSKVLLVAMLLCSLTMSRIVAKSDLDKEWIKDGDQITLNTSPSNPTFPIPLASWVWGPNWQSVPEGETRVFHEFFDLLCN